MDNFYLKTALRRLLAQRIKGKISVHVNPAMIVIDITPSGKGHAFHTCVSLTEVNETYESYVRVAWETYKLYNKFIRDKYFYW